MTIPIGKIRTVAELGAAIRAKRRALGLRQAELAGLVGVGTRFLSELENGKESAAIGKAFRVLMRLGFDVRLCRRGAGPERDSR